MNVTKLRRIGPPTIVEEMTGFKTLVSPSYSEQNDNCVYLLSLKKCLQKSRWLLDITIYAKGTNTLATLKAFYKTCAQMNNFTICGLPSAMKKIHKIC